MLSSIAWFARAYQLRELSTVLARPRLLIRYVWG
jgi:hypothetical protein